MKTFLEKQEKREGFQRLPRYAHPRQLPQTVSWGPSIRTLPKAADGLERNPPFGGATCQYRHYAPCGENICAEEPASPRPAAWRWGDGPWILREVSDSLLSNEVGDIVSTGNRGGWSDFQSVSALGVARSAQGQPIPKGFYLARHSWVIIKYWWKYKYSELCNGEPSADRLILITSQIISFAFNTHAHTLTQTHSESFLFLPSRSYFLNPEPACPCCQRHSSGARWPHIPFLLFCIWSASCSDRWPLDMVGDQVHGLQLLYQQVLTWEDFWGNRIFKCSSTIGCFANSSFNEPCFIWASICWLTQGAHSFQEVGLAIDAG